MIKLKIAVSNIHLFVFCISSFALLCADARYNKITPVMCWSCQFAKVALKSCFRCLKLTPARNVQILLNGNEKLCMCVNYWEKGGHINIFNPAVTLPR